MKSFYLLFLATILSSAVLAQSNIPQVVSFSAVVRDANNQPLANTPVSIRLTFKKGGSSGPLVYCALHQDVSNANGFISLQLNRNVLGTGCNGAPSTTFETIPWKEGGFWMEVEYQTVPNTPFTSLGQLELASSFYAFAAGSAEELKGVNLQGAQNGYVLAYNQSTGKWEPTPATAGPQGPIGPIGPQGPAGQNGIPGATGPAGPGYSNGTAQGQMMYWNGTSWITITPGSTGQTLTFCNGVPTWGPCPSSDVFNPNLTYGTMSDNDGNTYKTIVIGTQTWMAENLKTTKYQNGNPIPTNLTNTAWPNVTTGAYAIYLDNAAYNTTYGKLYNWYAVSDIRNLCPVGWHVPADAEWATLENYLGGTSVAGGKLKSTSSLWTSPNTGATNESGFSGLACGSRQANGQYSSGGFLACFWWSSTAFSSTYVWGRGVSYNGNNSDRYNNNKVDGHYVRCLKD